MEAFLQLVWQQRLWEDLRPVGVLEGCEVEILDVGLCNSNAGPDFFEAKVRIDDITWVGAVEIHARASEWLQHQHHLDPAYAGVVLHVVEEYDTPILGYNGHELPTLVMTVPQELRQRAEYLLQHATLLPCAPLGERLSPRLIEEHLETLLSERLSAKAEAVHRLAEQYGWHEALYITVMRYFGSELNNDAMEQLARALPYRLLIRYADSPCKFEALLLGVSGLLSSVPEGEYRSVLENEYRYLAHKHELSTLRLGWRQARTRPASFPLRRLLQASALLRKSSFTPTTYASCDSPEAMRLALSPLPLSDYWQALYAEGERNLGLGLSRETIDSLAINIILPYTLAHAEASGTRGRILPRLVGLLSMLPAERNKITRLFARAGVPLRHAGDGQAVIQAYKAYCSRRKCIYCPWGRRLLAMR